MRICVIFGTRPEAIKVLPIYIRFKELGVSVDLVHSGQHHELTEPVLKLFNTPPDITLDVMREGQSLSSLTARALTVLGELFESRRYASVIVQGDTTTAFAAALSAFYHKLPVGHVEAGLRTFDRYSPFPEEINRKIISSIATIHFAPTAHAESNLLRENVDPTAVVVTGNTVIDALRWVDENHSTSMEKAIFEIGLQGVKYILLTTHRRENIGVPMRNVLRTVREFLIANRTAVLVLPLHKNPAVRQIVLEVLEGQDRVRLIEAQGYLEFCALLKHSAFLITDSGGVQEEAPYFRKRTLVIRETTERPEAVTAGSAILVGTNPERLRSAMDAAWNAAVGGRPLELVDCSPFGDGYASDRICKAMIENAKN
ncbi:non-hydrolyzing UDP-N-acetylglucosamine 2-epimerase [Lacipirellula limnantheis]|uniref:UDP-N-acetylglucosamine 2-epimerase (non-hydrolyzing) n=1 Tax=Lacipirellula limnantheis TaxID=2528024 RepID=A0A517TY93_9BACT|nr:UDP-N-acetylglucosamine 2-epimerase (non-hydrolyzing) [Lacipirellula limnantheis]QDT73344.1 UDP-N-acetylglucosamine 2-epimerase [Lacipirellula limnantheis]